MAAHDGEKHSFQNRCLRDSPEFRALLETMTRIDPERRADAFEAAEEQDCNVDGEEEASASSSSGCPPASTDELGENVVPIEGGNGSGPRGDSEVPERRA